MIELTIAAMIFLPLAFCAWLAWQTFSLLIVNEPHAPYRFFIKPVGRWSPHEQMLRLFRIVWARKGGPGEKTRGWTAKLSLSLTKRIVGFHRGWHEWSVTLFGLRVHYLRSYGGWLTVLFLMLCTAPQFAYAGHPCRVLKQVVQPVYYPQQIQNISYFVGSPIRAEAIVQKAMNDDPEYAEFQKFKQWKSLAHGDAIPASPITGEPALLIKQKCAACHAGDNAAGGVVLDGSQAVSDATYRKFNRMYLLGADVPPKMKPLLDSLKAEEGSAILGELLKLEEPGATAADTEPDEAGVLK